MLVSQSSCFANQYQSSIAAGEVEIYLKAEVIIDLSRKFSSQKLIILQNMKKVKKRVRPRKLIFHPASFIENLNKIVK
jgi:hypothetical protein